MKNKKKILLRVCLAIVLVFLTLFGTAALYAVSKYKKILAVSESDGNLATGTGGDIVNILLLGLDYRKDWGEENTRADTNIICSFNKKSGQIKLISIERGVEFRITDTLWMPQYEILTHVYHEGGAELSKKVISRDLKVDLAGYVSIKFSAFKELIDAIGGVDIELTESEAASLNREAYTNSWTKQHVEPGLNHLDGNDALAYCRLRFNDDDWHRMERQQKCLQSCLSQIKKLTPKELDNFIDLALENVRTDVPASVITSLTLHALKFLKTPELEKMTVPVMKEDWYTKNYIECNFESEAARIDEFIYG